MDEGDEEEKGEEPEGGAGPVKGVGTLDMSLDVTGALKVLVNTGGRKVSSKAKQVSKDAYLGFLLLRHLKVRDLRTKVRGFSSASSSNSAHSVGYECDYHLPIFELCYITPNHYHAK